MTGKLKRYLILGSFAVPITHHITHPVAVPIQQCHAASPTFRYSPFPEDVVSLISVFSSQDARSRSVSVQPTKEVAFLGCQ